MVRLTGVDVTSFAHPDDMDMAKKLEALKVNTLIEKLSSMSTKITLATKLLGNYIHVNQTDMPELYRMLKNVCDTLDYPELPEIYLYRSEKFAWQIYLDKKPIIILTDFVLNDFDEGMLTFHLGCAVTALKAKTCQLRMLVTFGEALLKQNTGFVGALMPVIAKWSRATVLTEDRGGLLACQDINAAYRYMMRLSGLPMNWIDVTRVQDYIAEYKPLSRLEGGAKYIETLIKLSPWQNERLLHLYQWKNSGGYDDLLDEYC